MWGTQYIQEIQKQFISCYNFKPNENGLPSDVPDGEYPMWVEGRYDLVKIKNGMISCCNFDASKDMKKD